MLNHLGRLSLVFLLTLVSAAVVSGEEKEPTPEQLKKAKDDFAKIGATYREETDSHTKQVTHLFVMPEKTTDADLKKLPNPPFSFALSLNGTQVTDAGLKELKDLKNLTTLDLGFTKVTGAGLKELKDLKNLTTLNLEGTKVTDAGLKELQEALPKCTIIK